MIRQTPSCREKIARDMRSICSVGFPRWWLSSGELSHYSAVSKRVASEFANASHADREIRRLPPSRRRRQQSTTAPRCDHFLAEQRKLSGDGTPRSCKDRTARAVPLQIEDEGDLTEAGACGWAVNSVLHRVIHCLRKRRKLWLLRRIQVAAKEFKSALPLNCVGPVEEFQNSSVA